jgi:hypothetical protein
MRNSKKMLNTTGATYAYSGNEAGLTDEDVGIGRESVTAAPSNTAPTTASDADNKGKLGVSFSDSLLADALAPGVSPIALQSANTGAIHFGATLASTGFDGPYHVSPPRRRFNGTSPSDTYLFDEKLGHITLNPAATAETVEVVEKGDHKMSTMTRSYVDNQNIKERTESVTADHLLAAFQSFVDPSGCSISVFDAENVVKEAYGDDIPKWIIDIYVVMMRNKSKYHRVELEAFKSVYP